MNVNADFDTYVRKARVLAAFSSGSQQLGDEIVSAALEALEGKASEGPRGIFTVLFFREIAKAVIDRPLELSSEDDTDGRMKRRFSMLPPRERLAFWLVEISHFSVEMAAQVLELDLQAFDSLLTPAYRKFFRGFSSAPVETRASAVLH